MCDRMFHWNTYFKLLIVIVLHSNQHTSNYLYQSFIFCCFFLYFHLPTYVSDDSTRFWSNMSDATVKCRNFDGFKIGCIIISKSSNTYFPSIGVCFRDLNVLFLLLATSCGSALRSGLGKCMLFTFFSTSFCLFHFPSLPVSALILQNFVSVCNRCVFLTNEKTRNQVAQIILGANKISLKMVSAYDATIINGIWGSFDPFQLFSCFFLLYTSKYTLKMKHFRCWCCCCFYFPSNRTSHIIIHLNSINTGEIMN